MSYIRFLDFQFSIKDSITIQAGAGDFPEIMVSNQYAKARISLYGGQVLSFHPKDAEQDLLFLSPDAVFDDGVPIRGGIPVCWPWFGPSSKSGQPSHGVARTQTWSIEKTVQLSDGSSEVVLQLPPGDYGGLTGLALSLRICIGKTLLLELLTENVGDSPQVVSQALHSYFRVGKVSECNLEGLDQVEFVDKLHEDRFSIQQGDLTIKEPVDRIYLCDSNLINLRDPGLGRTINIQNAGNDSTVVWNPGCALKDLTGESYHQMVCVESARLNSNQHTILPNESLLLSTEIGVES